jgi:hypothetical protein
MEILALLAAPWTFLGMGRLFQPVWQTTELPSLPAQTSPRRVTCHYASRVISNHDMTRRPRPLCLHPLSVAQTYLLTATRRLVVFTFSAFVHSSRRALSSATSCWRVRDSRGAVSPMWRERRYVDRTLSNSSKWQSPYVQPAGIYRSPQQGGWCPNEVHDSGASV